MHDPYEKVWQDIGKALKTLSNMIAWLAKRTLSVKDYMDFADEFAEKKADSMEDLLTEMLKKDKEDT